MEDIYISKNRHSSETFEVNIFDEQTPPPPQEPEPKKRKKKKHKLLKTVVLLVAAFFILTSSFIFIFAAASGYTRNDLNENSYISSSSLKSSPLVTNILLLGVDGSADSSSRSDSMILVSIDFAHAKIKLTSFLRDGWVYIPSKERKGKLNSACTYGGPQLVADTIEYNFGVKIDHYVMVDFDMFTKIIDNLGGVDVEVTEKEAKYINKTTRHTIESGGSVHLDGAKALVYCRIRKLDTDYMRTYRQRKVITALIEQAKNSGISKLVSTMQSVFPLIETDMSPAEITALAYKGGISILAFDIEQNRVPTDDQMSADTINGQWVEVFDTDEVAEYLKDYIYTNKISLVE